MRVKIFAFVLLAVSILPAQTRMDLTRQSTLKRYTLAAGPNQLPTPSMLDTGTPIAIVTDALSAVSCTTAGGTTRAILQWTGSAWECVGTVGAIAGGSTGQFQVNNGGLLSGVTISGDATINSSGVLTLAASGATAGNCADPTFDAKGRVTSCVSISGDATVVPSTGVLTLGASGVSAGNCANPTVDGKGRVTACTATSGDATINGSGVLTLAASGVTAGTCPKPTVDAKGRATVCNTLTSADVGLNFAENETPTGSIDGSNATFALVNSPTNANAVRLWENAGSGTTSFILTSPQDFTLSGNTLTLTTPPPVGWVLRASYRY